MVSCLKTIMKVFDEFCVTWESPLDADRTCWGYIRIDEECMYIWDIELTQLNVVYPVHTLLTHDWVKCIQAKVDALFEHDEQFRQLLAVSLL